MDGVEPSHHPAPLPAFIGYKPTVSRSWHRFVAETALKGKEE